MTAAPHRTRPCSDAALIYPLLLESGLKTRIGGQVNVRSLAFSLRDDLDESGRELIDHLI